MLNIGAGEIALIVVVALLVLGPTRLPELARGIGKFLREFRSRTDEVRHVVEREFYRMDEEVQALPPRSIAPPSLVGRNAAPDAPSPEHTPPSPAAPEVPGHAAALPEQEQPLHARPTFYPDTVPLDPSFARTQQVPVLRSDEAADVGSARADAKADKEDAKP